MTSTAARPSLLQHHRIRRLDGAAAALAGQARGRGADRAVYLLSQAANHSMLWHGINLVDAATGGPDRRRRAIRRSIVVAAEQALVNGPVKMVVARDRPDAHDEHPHALRTPRTSSFPSGHASAGACAATLLSRDLGHAPLWWALALAVGWTRVHVGVHHGSDVVAGLALGRLLGLAAGSAWPPPPDRVAQGTID